MWRNYIKVTIRNLSRNKVFNLINISGLAIGLASSVFIILYIVHQLNFDRFHANGAQMYRLYIDGRMAGEELKGCGGEDQPLSGGACSSAADGIYGYYH